MLSLEVPPGLAAIEPAQDAIAAHLAEAGVAEPVALRVRLVVEELLANLAMHARFPGPPMPARIEVRVEEGGVTLLLEDAAEPFDPRDAPEPGGPPSLEDDRLGGLGLALVRRMTGRLDYRRSPAGRNCTEAWIPGR